MITYPESWSALAGGPFRHELIETLRDIQRPLEDLVALEVLNRVGDVIDQTFEFLYDDLHLRPDSASELIRVSLWDEAEAAAIDRLTISVDRVDEEIPPSPFRAEAALRHPAWPEVQSRAAEALALLLLRGEATIAY